MGLLNKIFGSSGDNERNNKSLNIEQYLDKEIIQKEFKELIPDEKKAEEFTEKFIKTISQGLEKALENVILSDDGSNEIPADSITILEEQIQGLTNELLQSTSRIKLCKIIKQFVRQYPEVYNSLRLKASYIVYGSSDISIEEYKTYILSLSEITPKEDVEKATLIVQKFDNHSKIKEYMFKIAMDLLECQDAFLEIIRNKDGKIVNVKYLPTETIEIELDRTGKPKAYYQIINLEEIPKYVDNNELSQYDYIKYEEKENIDKPYIQIKFKPKEILHFNDGSRIGVSDNPLLSMIIMWKFLRMVEEALVIHRITRARRFMIFFLDITGKTKEKARRDILSFTQKLKNVFSIDLSSSSLLGKSSIVKSALDLVIPITKDSNTKVQTIPADVSASKIDDLKFYLNRILTNLLTSWVFFPDRTGKEDIQRDAMIREIKIYQKHMSYSLSKFYEELLKERGLKDVIVEVLFPNPDSESEVKMTDVAVRRMMLLSQLSAIVGTSLPIDYILEFVFKDFPQTEIRQLINIIKETQQKAENTELANILTSSNSEAQESVYNDDNSISQFGNLDIINEILNKGNSSNNNLLISSNSNSNTNYGKKNYKSLEQVDFKEFNQNLNPEILKMLLRENYRKEK